MFGIGDSLTVQPVASNRMQWMMQGNQQVLISLICPINSAIQRRYLDITQIAPNLSRLLRVQQHHHPGIGFHHTTSAMGVLN